MEMKATLAEARIGLCGEGSGIALRQRENYAII